jgi:hypothetical protein
MPQIKNFFLFCMIFAVIPVYAQKTSTKIPIRYNTDLALQGIVFPVKFSETRIISGDFYTRNLPFFCKKELKFEAVTGVAFKFRLGSIQYCDRMEGKKSVSYP